VRAGLADQQPAAQRAALTRLVEHAVPVRVGFARYAVAITWTALGLALRRAVVAARPLPEPPTRAPEAEVMTDPGGRPPVLFFRSASVPASAPTDPAAALSGDAAVGRLSAMVRRPRATRLEVLRGLPAGALDALPEPDRTIVALYGGLADGEPHPPSELGPRFGMHPVSVADVVARSLVRLLGPEAVPGSWTTVACSVCGAPISVRRKQARSCACHVCGLDCRRELARWLHRERRGPGGGSIAGPDAHNPARA
jgi:hypothetical protein